MRHLLIILFGLFCTTMHSQGKKDMESLDLKNLDLLPSTLSEFDLDSTWIHEQVDQIITNGIKNEAFPGAQLLVAKDSKIIFHQAYGYHTYDSLQAVSVDDIYDLASVTKIVGPLPALMKLVDEGKLDLDAPFSTYWKSWKRHRDKKHLTLREILAHQAGLQPYIVFLNEVLKEGRLKKRFVRTVATNRFKNQAYPGLFVKNRFIYKMNRIINRSKVDEKKEYKYSGLAFLLFPQVIEDLTGQSYGYYLEKNFYLPIGAVTLGFLPENKDFPYKIVPTERDTLFRHALTQGWVHDENASLLGGISGNAGLFSDAKDLAKMMQLYQNYGSFNGIQYLSENTIKEFIRVQFPENGNRRGLGFDKPLPNNSELPLSEAYPAPEVSPESFGHSGFTGTFVWADPKNRLVFIFLSNRVYPIRDNRNLYSLNIRPKLQQVFYRAILARD